jgi:hypothetical protein
VLGFNHAVVSISELVHHDAMACYSRLIVYLGSCSQRIPTETFYDNSNTALSYAGRWANMTVEGIPNNTVTAPFHRALDAGSSVAMNFSNAVAIALYASTNIGHLLYSVVSFARFIEFIQNLNSASLVDR